MGVKRYAVTGLSWIVTFSIVLPGFAQQSPLAQVIEGAKKEGVVTAKLIPQFNIKLQERLRKEIREVYGVDLKLEYSPSPSYNQMAAQVLGEHKAGIASYDVVTSTGDSSLELIKAGAVERVNWLPLLPKGTPPEVVRFDSHFLAIFSAHRGLIYNTKKITAHEVPKRWSDLADPKWRGRFGLLYLGTNWKYMSYITGRSEEAKEGLRKVVKNNPMVGEYTDLYNRYLIGEVDMTETRDQWYDMANKKGVPTGFTSVEFSSFSFAALGVLKLAKHPNAAKLIAAYLSGPQGHKMMMEIPRGNLLYPGNFAHDIERQNKAQGLPFLESEDPGFLKFQDSEAGRKLDKELQEIIRKRR